MVWATTLPALVAICGDAPDPSHRSAAHRLLAREMMARLATTKRDFDRRLQGYPVHPARQALDAASIGANGGLGPATFYRRRQHGSWAASVPRTPAAQQTYTDELASIELEALVLIILASNDMGADFYEASRDRLVAYCLVGGSWNAVAPGGKFPLRLLAVPPAGFSVANDEVTVPSTGDYHVRFDGQVWTESTDDEPDIVVSYYDDGSEELLDALEREGTDPFRSVVFQEVHETVNLSGVLSIRNGSATFDQFAHGVLRVFEVADS